jgi:WS/DGAT/MGAT family acyltransferase
MSQLSGHDATFLYSDTAHSNSNVSLLHIYDQSTAPGGKLRFKTILAHIESRLDRSPVFRRRLQRVPLELDYPYWVEDENFDLEYHVRHIALPKPGDWRQFCIQASRIHARPLDLKRPLWEIYVIEGLDSFLDLPQGSFAVLTKTHHAAIDVESGSEITMLLHDITPTPPVASPPAPWFPESPPGTAAMLCRGMVNSVISPFRLARPLTRALMRYAPTAFTLAGDILLRPENMPPTRFNSVVSPHRVFETRRFTLDEFKTIRSLVRGVTVNDAVLAVCGGALRRYLGDKDELPEASLTAMAPFFIRGADAASGDKPDMSWLHVQLGTHLADPVRRLEHIHRQTASSDTVSRAVGARELTDIGQHAPAATLALTSKMLSRASLGIGRRAPLANCSITNVPGPSVPLYLCGARMTYFSAIMPIADGMGLVFAVTSYDGRIVISPTSCRELMPDPEMFAQCLRDSFQELLAAAAQPRKAAPRPRQKAPVAARKVTRSAPPRASSSGRRSPKHLPA